MNQQNNDDVNAVDFLLKGKPTAFQLELLQLGRRLHWDENDPGFAVPLAMGQIEHVLEVYPNRIKAAMDEVSHQSEMKWARIQAALKVSAEKGLQAASRIDSRLDEVKNLLDSEIEKVNRLLKEERIEMQQAMAAEREALQELMTQERADMTRLTQMVTEQQKQVLIAQTNELIAKGVVNSRETAASQVKEIVASARAAHFWQAAAWACSGAVGLVCLTLLVQGVSNRYSEWGRFERWNQQQLKDCRYVDSSTCNFHIKPPGPQ